MNLLQTIISYYHGEARHGFWAAIIGALLLLGGLMLLRWASPLSLLKGLSIPMLLFGLLVGIGGGADSIYTGKTTPTKIAIYQNDPTTFIKQEKVKVEKTHDSWHGIRVFWGILGLAGMALSFLIKKPFWIGAGMGTVALAIIISLFELYSMRFNERYYRVIQSVVAQEPETNINKSSSVQQLPVKMQLMKLDSNRQKQLRYGRITLQQQHPFDSLKTLSAPRLIAVEVRDSALTRRPNDLPYPTQASMMISNVPDDKEKQVPDYRISGAIEPGDADNKHCLFRKKYMKG